MSGSQKFISRNRAPRVQIEYDVELYGAEKKIQLPFVMGVMSDLSGKSQVPQPSIADRKFLEIDVDTFDERMKSMAPRAAFTVPDTLTGEGNIAVDITFESMKDFSPGAIAAKVPALAPLLAARRQLDDLMAYMDGKSGAEALIENLLAEPVLLKALGGGGSEPSDMDAALESLKARMPEPEPEDNTTDRTLADLAARAPEDAASTPSLDDVLVGIERREEVPREDRADDILAGIERRQDEEPADAADDVLARMERREDAPEEDETHDVLAGIERRAEMDEPDETTDVLDGIERREAAAEADRSDDVLAGIERREESVDRDETSNVLSGIERRAETVQDERSDSVLAEIERRDDADESDAADDVLAGVERREDVAAQDESADVLAGIERREEAPEDDRTENVLAGIERREDADEPDDAGDVLAGIERAEDEDYAKADETAGVLAGVERRDADVQEDRTDEILASLDPVATDPEDTSELDDVLAGLADADLPEEQPERLAEVSDELKEIAPNEDPATGAADDTSVDKIEPAAAETRETEPDLDDLLADLGGDAEADDDADIGETAELDDLDALLADLGGDKEPDVEHDGDEADKDDLDALLGDLDVGEAASAPVADEDPGDDDLDALLADLGGDREPAADESVDEAESDDLDALLGDLDGTDDATRSGSGEPVAENDAPASDADGDVDPEDDLDALLADPGGDGKPAGEESSDVAEKDDLDALLADLGASEAGWQAPDAEDAQDDLPDRATSDEEDSTGDLDDLLNELGASEVGEIPQVDDLDALLSDLTGDTAAPEASGDTAENDLDALLADMGATDLGEETAAAEVAEAPVPEPEAVSAAPAQSPYGTISEPQPERASMNRDRFRIAIFGDFAGRAARHLMETGDALAARTPILLDVDTVEDVIAGFATTLTLPIGKDGEGIEVRLEELDDLHPDELYEKVEIFEAIAGLRQQLGVGSMAGQVTDRLKDWAAEFGTPVKLPKRSAGTSVPPDLKLSDFQALIGDTTGTLTRSTPAEDLIARIVGPHVVKAPDAGAAEMLKAVDDALSSAMRLVLHHPEFQAVESQWRSLDLLARRIETDSELQIVLYDVSAEELAADLSAQEDLAQSGFYRLLTDVMDPEGGDGGFSALFGMYTFEETPPHAELLARIGQVAAHVDAPFFAAITPAYLETPKQERHKLVAEAWDTLRALPQAAYLGLASPRFMLRLPYGAKSEPCYEFEFEEFTPKEGLKGLLWANPVVLVAILLAATHKKDGRAMELGSLMSLGDIPFTYVTDRYGDQVALPCTERNLTSDAAQATLLRGYMPVLSMKGRNEIRLGSFRSLTGSEIAGPWADAVPTRTAPPHATLEVTVAAGDASGDEAADTGGADDDPLADLDALLDTVGDTGSDDAGSDDALDMLGADDDDTQSLDDLLASFADDGGSTDDDDGMDPELAALLEGL